MQEVNKALSPFLDPESAYYENAGETRNLTGTCNSYHRKKTKGKGKKSAPKGKKCSREKGHDGLHEHWQNGMRVRTWGD